MLPILPWPCTETLNPERNLSGTSKRNGALKEPKPGKKEIPADVLSELDSITTLDTLLHGNFLSKRYGVLGFERVLGFRL